MQPYFFPYIGYWQLINYVDKYVIFDDVNYIKRGWINRNRILFEGVPRYFNLRIHKASQNKLINELEIIRDEDKTMDLLHMAYKEAPYYEKIRGIIKEILSFENDNPAVFLGNQISKLCGFLGIETEILFSSSIEKNCNLHGQDKIIDICKHLGTTEYVNAIGGRDLYQKEKFMTYGIELHFIRTNNISYQQFDSQFIPALSIIDMMMFNSVEKIRKNLNYYELL